MSDTLPDHLPSPPRPARTLPDSSGKGRGCGTYLLGALALLLVLAGVGAYLVVTNARALVVEQAKLRHIVLQPGEVELGLSTITLRDASFSLEGVTGLSGRATELTIEHAWLTPKRVVATGLTVDVTSTEALQGLGAWSAKHGSYTLPLTASGASLRIGPKAEATLVGDLDLQPGRGTLRGTTLRTLEAAVAIPELSLELSAGKLTLDARREPAPTTHLLRAVLDTDASPVAVEVTLYSQLAADLAGSLGAVTNLSGLVRGSLKTTLPRFEQNEPLVGSLELELTGYVPPHTKELDGIVFGDTTKLSAKFDAKSPSDIALTDVRVAAGALSLGGSGSVSARSDGARVRLDVSGNIPCSQLATSAASANLGPMLGALAGNLARQSLGGDIAVRLFVDLDTTNPKGAKIDPSAVVRCSVKL